MKIYYYRLFNKELYFYKKKDSDEIKGMNSLVGAHFGGDFEE